MNVIRNIRENTTILEVVFTHEGVERYVHKLAVLSARSVGAGIAKAVQQFQKECPGVALTDGVTIALRNADLS
jgi:hypothetical protein